MRGARRVVGGGFFSLFLFAVFSFAWTGCASRSPDRQEFVEIRSPNFILTSSLSREKSIEFARSLEFFHVGVRSILGQVEDLPAAAPAMVFVFDDRSLGRPFAVHNQAAYLLDEVEAPILVFRGDRDFAAWATPEMFWAISLEPRAASARLRTSVAASTDSTSSSSCVTRIPVGLAIFAITCATFCG